MNPRIGPIALALSLGGVVLAVGCGLLARRNGYDTDLAAYALFLAFQIAAFILGCVARKAPFGKTAAITSGVLALGSIVLVG